MKLAHVILLSFCGCTTAVTPSMAEQGDRPLSAHQVGELQTLASMLSEANRSEKTRFQAARLLLTKDHSAADKILADLLADASARPARVAIASAIAETGMGRPPFVEPLFEMTGDAEAAVRQIAASALAAYKTPEVLQRLTGLARDVKTPEPRRLAAVSALGQILDKRSVDTLISLLEDPQPDVRSAAATALAKLTGIRSFGDDSARWRVWWRSSQNKSPQQWLADLAESLAQDNTALRSQLEQLRARLADATTQLYEVTDPAGRPALVLTMLKDPLAEVRRIGLQLATRRAAAGEPVAKETAQIVAALLGDNDASVRAAAALLVASLGDAQAGKALLDRLQVETVVQVRTALITALGELRVVEAADALLGALTQDPNEPAAAAAAALRRLAEKDLLNEAQVGKAEEVIVTRYSGSQASPKLRAALLGSMGALARPAFAGVMQGALQDSDAAVRLEAVRGLQKLSDPGSAKHIAPLADDPDRGVRQEAIAALGALGDPAHLDTVLARTQADVESDSAVRRKAWESVHKLLSSVDVQRILDVAGKLADRPEARDDRIKMLTLCVDRLEGKAPEQMTVRMELADAQLAAGLPAEAAKTLAKAHGAAGPDQAGQVWLKWMEALLAADDAASVTHIAQQSDEKLRPAAIALLVQRLAALQEEGQHQPAITLADQAVEKLGASLPAPAKDEILAMSAKAVEHLVASLVKDLAGNGDAAQNAKEQLLAMGTRAVMPLVASLQQALAGEPPSPAAEKAILPILGQLDQGLTGYNAEAAVADKIKIVDGWLEKLRT